MFDSMDILGDLDRREILINAIRELDIREGLQKVEKMIRGTKIKA